MNSFAASESGRAKGEAGAAGQFQLTPQVSRRALAAAHPQWRITAEGRLEHFTSGGWNRVLPNQTAVFRVLSLIGDDVWAGGNGGALFHSRDGGQHWSNVALTAPGGSEPDDIVSIQFDDIQHGVVATGDGSRYSTSDRGATWTKD
jgi:photosystem II stability/assembly factor-like uncharacterized protein